MKLSSNAGGTGLLEPARRGSRPMRTATLILATAAVVCLPLAAAATRLAAQPSNASLAAPNGRTNASELHIAVFFGTKKALQAEEIKTNAANALRARGYVVPEPNRCVINVEVAGKEPGCAVLFWDLKATQSYQVLFDARGEVTSVSGGAVEHGGPGPKAPRPPKPEGGVRVKP